jgi:hypothetical protein
MMTITSGILAETIATLIGIFVGTLSALVIDRWNQRRKLRRQAKVVLRSLSQELSENFKNIQNARPAYTSTSWGKSFYVSTVAWETALAGGDLPNIIGFELTDLISAQYALLARIRYYVDLLTQLWFAPQDVPGRDEIRRGFHKAITETMSQTIRQHTGIMRQIEQAIAEP